VDVTFPQQFPRSAGCKRTSAPASVDDKKIAETMADGVNVVIGGTNAGGPNGFCRRPLGIEQGRQRLRRDPHGRADGAGEHGANERNVREVHARGGKVLSEAIRMNMVPLGPGRASRWQDMNQPGGKPIKPEELARNHVLGCWNSPYGDFFIRSQVMLLKTFDYDGYNLDGFGCWSQCYCPSCKRAYKADTSRDIPLGADVNNPKWRHYVKWRLWRYTRFVQRWTAALKAVKPDFVAAPWTTGPGRWCTGWGLRRSREAMRCTACSMHRSSSCSGIFRPTRAATCCRPSRCVITVG